MKFAYEIDGTTYIQRPLVLGQLARLTSSLKGVVLYGTTPFAIVGAVGEQLPDLLACVLVPEGTHPRDVDQRQLVAALYDCPPEVAIKVVEDFFACNPLVSLLERLTGIVDRQATIGTDSAAS